MDTPPSLKASREDEPGVSTGFNILQICLATQNPVELPGLSKYVTEIVFLARRVNSLAVDPQLFKENIPAIHEPATLTSS